MTHQHPTSEEGYLSTFESSMQSTFAKDPQWINTIRRNAIGSFLNLRFPTARRGNEEWKYTDIGRIASHRFELNDNSRPKGLIDEEIEAHAFAGAQRSRLVFVNGAFARELSSVDALPAGVTLKNLGDTFVDYSHVTEAHLAEHAKFETNAFTALNTAFLQDGVLLEIPDGLAVPNLIQLMFVSVPTDQRAMTNPRLLVVLGAHAHASIIESHVGLGGGDYFTNSVTEIILGHGAQLNHHNLQYEGKDAFHISTNQVVQKQDSVYQSVVLDTGGGLVRHNINVLLQEKGATVSLYGLYLLDAEQHVDYSTFIDHSVPLTNSYELYKGVLADSAHAVFGGKILVRPGAQQTNSRQTNKTLLLSQGAAVDTKPELEIYADDVKCAHGAAIGQMDEAALFYLKSRGISEENARRLLTHGFVSEVLEAVTHIPFRAYLDQLIHARWATV